MTVRAARSIAVNVPGDKSISHRALILSALANGTSRISGLLRSADVLSTLGALRTLGVGIDDGGVVTVRGAGRLASPTKPLDCGNSGTTTRLLAGVAAAQPFVSRFVGDASLSRRPMRRVADPLRAMGATITFDAGDGLPMEVHGATLYPIGWSSPTASAQVKSAILLAAVAGGVSATVTEPARSRDHTERMLAAHGVEVIVDGLTVSVGAARRGLSPADTVVPGDPSTAAFWVAFAALSSGVEVILPGVCVNPTRTGFLDVARRMGVPVRIDDERVIGGEPVGTIVASSAEHLRGVTIHPEQVPSMIDELPLVAALGARADGETRITGAGELRVKESDRIGTVVANLRAIGADADETPDGLTVRGRDRAFRGAVITRADHRIAMAFAVLGAATHGDVRVDDAACVAVSYPNFWEELERVRT